MLTIAVAMMFTASFCFAAESGSTDEHFYAVDQDGNTYDDLAVIEIPAGYAAFLYFDSTYKKINGKKASDIIGWDQNALQNAGFVDVLGMAGEVGFSYYNIDRFGVRIDASYAEAGTECQMGYWVYQEDKNFDFVSTPILMTKTLVIKITDPKEKVQPNVSKADQTGLEIKNSKKTVKQSKLSKGSVTVKPLKVTPSYGSKGAVSYSKVSGSGKLTVDKKTGKVTVKKGTKKGTYTAKVKITIASDKIFKKTNKTKTVKIVVK